jgi:phosphatidate cytidylyltransferase
MNLRILWQTTKAGTDDSEDIDMALKKFISSMVGLVLFFVIIFLPPYVLGAVVFFITIIATYEYNKCVKAAGYNNYAIASYLPVLLILFAIFKFETDLDSLTAVKYVISGYLLLYMTLLSAYLLSHKKHQLKDVFTTVFAITYIAPLFFTLIAVRYMIYGNYHIFLAFGGAWLTDTFAYFAGKLFGKRKLIPLISPNKTRAGAIGGLIGTTACTVIYGALINRYVYTVHISIFIFLALGIMLAVFSQAGDLTASAIKRNSKIKDFGNLMPGHGGALDRFDSVLFSSALTFIFILMFFRR